MGNDCEDVVRAMGSASREMLVSEHGHECHHTSADSWGRPHPRMALRRRARPLRPHLDRVRGVEPRGLELRVQRVSAPGLRVLSAGLVRGRAASEQPAQAIAQPRGEQNARAKARAGSSV